MFHQITKKIIALVTTVCLLVGVMVVPSAAANDTQMYLYNGVALPALPVWDSDKYPYAVIGERTDGYCFLARDFVVKLSSESSLVLTLGDVRYVLIDGVWEENSYTYPMTKVIWANHDLYYSDNVDNVGGTLFLAASDPVPVIDDFPIYDDIPVDNGPPVVETVPDSESIIEVLNSILEYDVATWNLLAYGTNRIRYIERYVADIREALLKLVPSEQETALKESTKETTQAVTDSFFSGGASERGSGFSVDDVTGAAWVAGEARQALSTGVGVDDLSAVWSDYTWDGWFTETTKDNLDTVYPFTPYSTEDPYNSYYYSGNLAGIGRYLD